MFARPHQGFHILASQTKSTVIFDVKHVGVPSKRYGYPVSSHVSVTKISALGHETDVFSAAIILLQVQPPEQLETRSGYETPLANIAFNGSKKCTLL